MSYVATRKNGLAGHRPSRRSRPNGLGDVLCFEGDCKAGTLLVQEMQATFKQLSGVGKDELDDSDVAFMRQFGQPVTQTVEAFQREDAKLTRQIPFSLVCCTIKELGRKAQDLTRQMREFRKVAQTTPTPITPPFSSPSTDIGKGIGNLLLIAGVALAAVIVLPTLMKKQH